MNKPFNKNVLLFVTMATNFLNPLMGSAVNVALPDIASTFHLDAVLMSWVPMAYLLSSAIFLVPVAKLADMFGRRKFFLWGNIIFMLGSLFCALSFSGFSLIASRFVQGIGGAMMYSTGMAIVISAFPPQERGKIIGLNVSAVYLGLSLAPVLGGVLTEALGWRSIFYINTAATLFIVLAIAYKVKAEWIEAGNDSFDWKGTLLFMPSMSALMYGFSKLPETYAIVLTVAGLIGLAFFVAVELKVEFPILNMKLFTANKVFAGANTAAFINYAATFAVSFVLSLYLQYVKGLSPKEAGMILITQPVLMAVVAIVAGRLSDKLNPSIFASIGMALSVVGLFMMSYLAGDTTIVYIMISLAVLGFGFGLFSSPNTTIIMNSVERKHYGLASATVGTMRTTGMMFSMAMASLAVHLFIGNNIIQESNIPEFLKSVRLIFTVFSILCVGGVFVSLIKKK